MMIGRQDIVLFSARPVVQDSGFCVVMKKQGIYRSVEEKRRNQNDMTGDEDRKYS
jgi:hypothetical protein